MSQLRVLSDDAWIGTLDVTEGRWSFAYAPEWTIHPLAPGFPLTVRDYQDAGEHRPVEWFFENLLPEGRLRELIAFRDRIDPRDSWAFLVGHGQDTAGALSLVPVNPDGDVPGEVLVPLSQEDLQAKIEESRKRNLPLMASWDDIRMSLAGAQEKLGLRIDPDGVMFLHRPSRRCRQCSHSVGGFQLPDRQPRRAREEHRLPAARAESRGGSLLRHAVCRSLFAAGHHVDEYCRREQTRSFWSMHWHHSMYPLPI